MSEKILTHRLLTVNETAYLLACSPRTIRNGISRNAVNRFPIKPIRNGRSVRFDSRDVYKYIDQLKKATG